MMWGKLLNRLNPPWELNEYIVDACGPCLGRLWIGSSTDLLGAAKDAACSEQDFQLAADIRDLARSHAQKVPE
jgi:hypothetical protein